jgi:hypothetical protein
MPIIRRFGIAEPMVQLLAESGIVLMGAVVLKFIYSEARDYYGMTASAPGQEYGHKIR